jgi:DNA-directed RNA polymerase specialized sigma24 family protein
MTTRRPVPPPCVAVITGDVVRSTELAAGDDLVKLLTAAFAPLRPPALLRRFEIFRGDGFQGVVRADQALRAAALLRARLRAHRQRDGDRHGPLDARLAIGIGAVDRMAAKLALSNGEAFRLSGRALDAMDRSLDAPRLALAIAPGVTRKFGATAGPLVAALLAELVRRFDDIVSAWSAPAADAVLGVWADELTQAEAAARANVTQSAVSQRLRAAQVEEAARLEQLFARTIGASLAK